MDRKPSLQVQRPARRVCAAVSPGLPLAKPLGCAVAIGLLSACLIWPAWCCPEHGHAAWEVSPGELSTELALSIPAPKTSSSSRFSQAPRAPDVILAVGRAAQGVVVPQRGASQRNRGSAASTLLPTQRAVSAGRSWSMRAREHHQRSGERRAAALPSFPS